MRPIILSAWMLVGCGAGFLYTRTTTANVEAKPEGCDFVVLGTAPARPHEEVGILDGDHSCPDDVRKYRLAIQKQVCAAGGDAVISQVSGLGCYVRGVVIRWTKE